MPSTRTLARLVGTVSILAFVGVATAQYGDPRSAIGGTSRFALQFLVGFVVNALLGGALVALDSGYATRKLAEIREETGQTVTWGLIVSIGGPIVIFVLAITIIGLLVAIPAAILLVILGIVGSAVTVVLVGSAGTGADAPGGTEVLVGALVLALVTSIPAVGGFINWLVSLPGVGVVGHDLYRSWRG